MEVDIEPLPSKLKKLIQKQKIKISYLNIDSVYWFLYKNNIWINKNLSYNLKHFTLLHELGHFIIRKRRLVFDIRQEEA